MALFDVFSCHPAGFNTEPFEYKNIWFTVWDVDGQDKIRPLWRHYYHNTQGNILYGITATSSSRMVPLDDRAHQQVT